jgi:tripeptide aminopeptidase
MRIERFLENAILFQGIPAPTFMEQARAAAIRSMFESIEVLEVEQDPDGNVLARLAGGQVPPVIISAHLDSVFPLSTPLEIKRESNRIIGPGIGDNALGLACLVELAHDLKSTPLPGDLWLIANVGEEGLGNLAGMQAIVDRFGGKPSAYLAIEGMALGYVYHRALPVRRYRITIQGESGHAWVHAGRPSALHALIQLASQISQLRLPRKPRTTLNIGMIQGGSSINTIAADASLEFEVRTEDEWMLNKLDHTVQRICSQKNLHEPLKIQLSVIGERPGGAISADHALVRLAQELAERHTGFAPELGIASTDASMPLSRGYPAICIGITHGGNAHSKEEFIETEMIPRGYMALLELITTWAEMNQSSE